MYCVQKMKQNGKNLTGSLRYNYNMNCSNNNSINNNNIRFTIHLMFKLLRDMAVIWSKFRYDDPGEDIRQLKENGKMIYNLLSIFYDSQWITGVIWALNEVII